MKAIRKLIDNNKALFTFGLVFFFLFAGMARSFAATKALHGQVKKEQSGTYLLDGEGDDNRFDELKAFDCDADDLELAFFSEFIPTKFFTTVKPAGTYAHFSACKNSFTVPLYDLFCNWKLHVS